MQHAVHALGRRKQLRQMHDVALHQLQSRVALQVLQVVGRTLVEAVKHRHLSRTPFQQHLGRC